MINDKLILSRTVDADVEKHLTSAQSVRKHFEAQNRTGDSAPAYFIRTFGCQQNEADSERLSGLCRMMDSVLISSSAV